MLSTSHQMKPAKSVVENGRRAKDVQPGFTKVRLSSSLVWRLQCFHLSTTTTTTTTTTTDKTIWRPDSNLLHPQHHHHNKEGRYLFPPQCVIMYQKRRDHKVVEAGQVP